MDISLLSSIDTVAAAGKTVVSGSDDEVLAVLKEAVQADRSVSFYLTPAVAKAFKEWYWTPERVKLIGIEPITDSEAAKIKSELGIEHFTNFHYAPIKCQCGHVYGAFDFFQQGVREHGLPAVNAVFALKHCTLLQVNPSFVPVCPACGLDLKRRIKEAGGGQYNCDQYGGCCCCARLVFGSPGAKGGSKDSASPQ